MNSVVAEIEEIFEKHGQEHYGEGVSQIEHALQCAYEAKAAGAQESLIAAALLHDIGHLIELEKDDEFGVHRHNRSGAAYLARHFGPEVTEPVRLHVAAKRYLCSVEGEYFGCLSPASVHSLEKQGGPMSEDEVAAFRAQPGWEEAVALRRWDDMGKVVGREVPNFAAYRSLLSDLVAA